MPNYTVMVVHNGSTGLPTDRFVNTLHWSGTGTLETDGPNIADRLNQFFNSVTSSGGIVWQKYSNGITDAEVRIYDMADPEPKVPLIIPLEALPMRSAATDLPREVALVLSLHGSPPITPRRRGRMFLGPFNTSVNAATGIPTDSYLQDVVNSADRMAELNTTDLVWVIYSPTTGLFVPVRGGFCDNAFDTIRSRGLDPTSRREFLAPV